MNPVNESNTKWAIRKLLNKHFNININDMNISLSSTGCSIFKDNQIFVVFPPEGNSALNKAKDVIFQLQEKYPELNL